MKTIKRKGVYQLSSRFLLAGILREACVRSLGGSLKHTHSQLHTRAVTDF